MSTYHTRSVRTVDSHTEGNPTRVIVGGVPVPPGNTLLEKRAWLRDHDDGLRRMLNFEPRGSGLMCSVLLLPPETDSADFSVIIMEQREYVPMCGHCIIGTAMTVVSEGMVPVVEPVTTVRFDTPAGLVTCEVSVRDGQVGAVSFENVESFTLCSDASLDVPDLGRISVDIAYGGDFYVIVDADSLDLDLSLQNDQQLIDFSIRIREAVADQIETVHPERPDINTCYQVLFTSSKTSQGDYKQTILCPPGSLDRSPCGTGTSARVALLHDRGEIGLGETRAFEGPLGTCMHGEAVRAEQRGGTTFVTPRITGTAWITGYHHFVMAPDDPLQMGYRVGPA
ncbi:proline racemase family protein [Elongatibacter sediminis]|uniref:Proline racemase family protein n=1 Tax=Elongatibacter sediminis TaxID=3119006 RepID=A0AAW9RG37_9GAMM